MPWARERAEHAAGPTEGVDQCIGDEGVQQRRQQVGVGRGVDDALGLQEALYGGEDCTHSLESRPKCVCKLPDRGCSVCVATHAHTWLVGGLAALG